MRAREFGKLRHLAVAGDRRAARLFCVACSARQIDRARSCPLRGCAICPALVGLGRLDDECDASHGSTAGSGGAP